MANEISLSVSFTANKDGASEAVSGTKSLTMTGNDMYSTTVTTALSGAAPTALTLGGITLGGFLLLKNLSTDATAILEIGDGDATQGGFAASRFSHVGPGEIGVIKTIVGRSYYVRSASASLTVFAQITAIEP